MGRLHLNSFITCPTRHLDCHMMLFPYHDRWFSRSSRRAANSFIIIPLHLKQDRPRLIIWSSWSSRISSLIFTQLHFFIVSSCELLLSPLSSSLTSNMICTRQPPRQLDYHIMLHLYHDLWFSRSSGGALNSFMAYFAYSSNARFCDVVSASEAAPTLFHLTYIG